MRMTALNLDWDFDEEIKEADYQSYNSWRVEAVSRNYCFAKNNNIIYAYERDPVTHKARYCTGLFDLKEKTGTLKEVSYADLEEN